MIKKIITLLLITLLCCPLASAGLPDLVVTPTSKTVEAYPGQSLTFEFTYQFTESELGTYQIESDTYNKKVTLIEQSPGIIGIPSTATKLYQDEFIVQMGETTAMSVPYTVDHDVGDDYYLSIYVTGYQVNEEPYSDYWSLNSWDRCSVHVTVIEEPETIVDDDVTVDLGDISYNGFSLDNTNILIGLIAVSLLGIMWYGGILQRAVQMIMINPLLAVVGITAFIVMAVMVL